MNKSAPKMFLLVATVLFLSRSIVVQSDDVKPWTLDEKDIDIYTSAREPAAVPLHDTAVKNRISEYIQIQNTNGINLEVKIIDTYGKTRKYSNGNVKIHHGWDFAAPSNSNILWMYDESETIVEGKYYSPWNGENESASYGYQISFKTKKNDNDYVFRFCHILNETTYNQWNSGTKINQGAVIAKVGTSGRKPNAPTPHLHLEIFKRFNNKYERIDPLAFFSIDYRRDRTIPYESQSSPIIERLAANNCFERGFCYAAASQKPLKQGVIAPRKARRHLQGESPCREVIRDDHL
jgi:hypothetical protein